jgi:regulator of protease activity HflC (stomatin/prohibitin superfamily)
MFIEKLIDLLVQFATWLLPFVIIDAFERGVVLRFGRYSRVLEPGIHWTWPLGIERVLTDNVVTRTGTTGVQSLLTKDWKTITVKAVITSKIVDIKAAILEVEGVDHALIDACNGAIGTYIAAHTWDEVASEETPNELAKVCRRNAKKYGIEIERVQLVDLTPARAIRLLQESSLQAPTQA